MLLKLALRNIRRSVRDYAIYFVTLTIGVAVFYAFSSIEGQQIVLDLQTEADRKQFELAQSMLDMFSWVIACVLGFLVIYTNRFLIRRRKKEFGTYLLLGMPSLSVSTIVLIETLAVGVFALIVGSLLGILLSQALSFATAALFEVQIKDYQFVFSVNGLMVTIRYFAIIFIVVAVFNTFSVNRYKLIDLLAADKKNERGRVRNPWVCLAAFLISIAILAYAYTQLIESGLVMLDDPRFLRATVAMLIGSLIFFWSLSGFLIAIITRVKGIYFRGLSMFTVRQIASKVNTAFASFWVICVLLFFSITIFSSGLGLVEVFAGDMDKKLPYSVTATAEVWGSPVDKIRAASPSPDARAIEMKAEAPDRYAQGMEYDWDMASYLIAHAPQQWDQLVDDYAQIQVYEIPGVIYNTLFEQAEKHDPSLQIGDELENAGNFDLSVCALSDLNDMRRMLGEDTIDIADNQCVMVNNMSISENIADAIARSRASFSYDGREYTFIDKVDEMQTMNNTLESTALMIAVPDELVDLLKSQGVIPSNCYLNVEYKEEGEESDKLFADIIAASQPKSMGGFDRGFAGADDPWASLLWPVTSTYTKTYMLSQSNGLKLMITYLALYIGFVFLMSTATILAIQQLSEAADSVPRYRLLSKLGCSRRMIDRSLLIQVLLCFLIPLGLAVSHSTCAIGVLNESMFRPMGVYVITPIIMAALLVLAVYGVYLLITYLVSRSFVNSNLSA